MVVATSHDQLAALGRAGARGRRARAASRSRPGSARRRSSALRRGGGARAGAASRSASTTASTPGSPAPPTEVHSGEHGELMHVRGPLRPRRAARLRPRVARRAGALGRRRAGRPGHAPARPLALARRPAAAALRAAAHALLGHAGRGQRGAACSATRTRATAPWAMLHVTLDGVEEHVLARDLLPHRQAPGRGPRALLRAADAAHLPHEARSSGPPDVEEIDYPAEDASWAAEWEHFAAALAAGDGRRCSATSADARYAWDAVEARLRRWRRTRRCGRAGAMRPRARHRRLAWASARAVAEALAARGARLVLVARGADGARGDALAALPGEGHEAHRARRQRRGRAGTSSPPPRASSTGWSAPPACWARSARSGSYEPRRVPRARSRSTCVGTLLADAPLPARPARRRRRDRDLLRRRRDRRRCRASTPTRPPRPRSCA